MRGLAAAAADDDDDAEEDETAASSSESTAARADLSVFAALRGRDDDGELSRDFPLDFPLDFALDFTLAEDDAEAAAVDGSSACSRFRFFVSAASEVEAMASKHCAH